MVNNRLSGYKSKSIMMKYVGITSIVLCLSIYSIISVIECTNLPDGYELLILLPVSYLICFLFIISQLYIRKKIVENIPIVLTMVLLALRNIITPIFMVKDSFVSSLGIPSAEYARRAIILTAYETIAISIAMYCFENKTYISKRIKRIQLESISTYKMVLYFMVAICVVSFLIIPEFRSQYYTIFTKDITHLVHEETNYHVGSIMRIVATLSEVCMGAVRLIVPSSIIYHLAQKGETLRNLFLSIICVLSQVLFMNDSNAFILMILVSQFLFLYRLFPKYHKLIVRSISCFSVTFLIVLYINRFSTDHYSNSFSLFLQSYVPSIANTAGIYNVEPKHSISQIFNDFFVAIPFKSTFGYKGNVLSTNNLWGTYNNIKGQIMPNVAQSYYYFGSILSPLLSCLCLYISIRINKNIKNEDNAIKYAVYQYIMVYSAAVPFVYNSCIFMQCFLQRMIFMLLVAVLAPFKLSSIKHLQEGSDYNNE